MSAGYDEAPLTVRNRSLADIGFGPDIDLFDEPPNRFGGHIGGHSNLSC